MKSSSAGKANNPATPQMEDSFASDSSEVEYNVNVSPRKAEQERIEQRRQEIRQEMQEHEIERLSKLPLAIIKSSSLFRKNTRGELDDSVKRRILHNSALTDARLAHSTTLLMRENFKAKAVISSSTSVIHEGEEFTRVGLRRSLVKDDKLEAATKPHSPKLHTMKRFTLRKN